MAEWSNAAVSKTVVRLPANRGFESPSLRKGSLPGIAEGNPLKIIVFILYSALSEPYN